MAQALNHLDESASQTAGPYVHIGCTPAFAGLEAVYNSTDLGSCMVNADTRGERIKISGCLQDGTGTPVRDGLIEIWQADHSGFFNSPSETRGGADPNFSCWGRQPTDRTSGAYAFETIKPGRVPHLSGVLQAPHVSFWIAARGVNLGLHTRMYFSDEVEANAEDPVLSRIEHKVRVPTIVAERNGNEYRFDIHLQGDQETIFFDI